MASKPHKRCNTVLLCAVSCRFIRGGTLFDNFYVTPQCAQTRAELLTGRSYARSGTMLVHGGEPAAAAAATAATAAYPVVLLGHNQAYAHGQCAGGGGQAYPAAAMLYG
jgi:hypothetical protein